MKRGITFAIFTILAIVLYSQKQPHQNGEKGSNRILKIAAQPADLIEVDKILNEADSWDSIEKRTSKLESLDQVNDRIVSIDAFIESKGLIRKINKRVASHREVTLFTELTRERALLYRQKINLDLSRIEKEIL